MSTATSTTTIPTLTLGWRMRMAMEGSGHTAATIGGVLGYSRKSVSLWLHDRSEPRPVVLAQWALLTGVDAEWLRTGDVIDLTPSPDGGVRTGNRWDVATSLDAHRDPTRARPRHLAAAA